MVYIIQITRHRETNTTKNKEMKNNRQKHIATSAMQTNQSAMTTEHFDPPADT